MQLKQAKEYFSLGIVTGFQVVKPATLERGWCLVIDGKEGRSWVLLTQGGSDRVFASLDTLVGVVEDIAGRVTSLNIRT